MRPRGFGVGGKTLLLTTGGRHMAEYRSDDGPGRVESSLHHLDITKLFDLSMDMMCVAGTDGHFLQVNPAFERVLGWTEDEMYARPIISFIHPEDREPTVGALQALGEGSEVIDFENRYQHRDGSVRRLQWRAVPAGELIYAVARDVTEVRREEEQQQRLEDRMRQSQKLESLGLLAGGVAHDFNNLLSGILGHAQLAQLKLALESPLRHDISMIETAALRASELCNQMLAYSGKGRFVSQQFRLSDMVSEMAHLLRISIAKDIQLRLDLDEGTPWVQGDITQIRQVVMNLISNAAEAIGDQAGEIHLVTGSTRETAESLAYLQFGESLEPGRFAFFEVADTGDGMDLETQKRIFDPFFSTKFTGRGLGLAAVLGIVRGHGGAIHVHSEVGRGTRIRILQPIEESVDEIQDPRETTGAFQGSGTALVADDDDNARGVAEQLLLHLGFDVLTAVDGVECLELYDRQPDTIRVILLDLTMPRLDGKATLEALQERHPGVRVLMTSGYSRQAVELPPDSEERLGFLQKPYRLEDLTEGLRRILASDDSD